MSAALPPVPPAVVAEAVQALPSRLRRKLDETVARAADWPLSTVDSAVTVTVDESTVVTLCQPVTTGDDVTCTCLMSPRCAHRAAVLSLAPAATGPAADAGHPATAPDEPGEAAAPLTDAECAAGAALWRAGVAVLAHGVPGTGAVAQAVLLRAAHEARALGLHRPATAAIRVVEDARSARRGNATFRLGTLVDDLRELLTVSHLTRTRVGDPDLVRGTARRAYRDCGDLRLYGLCCVPVLSKTGYAGAVTYAADAKGRLWQVSNVTPGGVELAAGRPSAGIGLGDAALSHRELGRAGLYVNNARASADGRLSAGKEVRAVRASGVDWFTAPLDGWWQRPLADQVTAYQAARRLPEEDRPCGHDLAFLDGTLGPAEPDHVPLTLRAGHMVRVAAPFDHPSLPGLANLRLLPAGRPLRLIGRFTTAGTVQALAVTWPELPARFEGHVDLCVDRLTREDLVPVAGGAAPASPEPPDAGSAHPQSAHPESALVGVPGPAAAATWGAGAGVPDHLLGRRVRRAVEGGRLAIAGPPGDVPRLHGAGLPTAAALATRLDTLSVPRPRDRYGRPGSAADDDLGTAWLAAATYLDALATHAESARWLS